MLNKEEVEECLLDYILELFVRRVKYTSVHKLKALKHALKSCFFVFS